VARAEGPLEVALRTRLGALELDVELAVAPGECLALAGPSGAGKTSVLRTVAGLLRPSEGRVSCGGELWLDTACGLSLPPERRRCGYVFQDHALFPHLTAVQNVAYALPRLGRAERRRRAHAALERFATDFTGALALAAVLVAVSAALLAAVKLAVRPGALGVPAR